MKKTNNIVILTALPFRQHGNQSLYRFVEMLVVNGCNVFMFTSGKDNNGESNFSNKNFFFYKLSNSSQFMMNLVIRTYKIIMQLISKKKPFSSINFFETINSKDQFPPYGSHSVKKLALGWFNFCLVFLENIGVFLYMIVFKYRILKEADVFVAYEVNFSISTKLISRVFGKRYINKYQGTILKACGTNIKCCKLFYPLNYFGINRSDLCIMVNDGTNGDFYCKSRGLTNVIFESHGVKDYNYNEIDIAKFLDVRFDKFIVFNNASGARWKRVDRALRFIKLLDQSVRDKIQIISTHNSSDLQNLMDFAKKLDVDDNILFITNLNQTECNYLLRKSSVLLMTNDMSNLGNPVLEAVYYSKPIISLNDGSLSSILEDGVDSILLNLDDSFDLNLAESIKRLVLDKQFYLKLENNILMNNKVYSLNIQRTKEFNHIKKILDPVN